MSAIDRSGSASRPGWGVTIVTGLVALSLALQPGIAWAATSIEVSSATRSGDILSVTGTSSFADEPFVELGSDPPLDALPPGPSGLDLTGAAVRTKTNGDLEFRWTLTGLPPVLNGLDMTFLGWTFCALGAQQMCFELDAGRFYHSQKMEQPAWSGQLWRCADATCAWPVQTPTSTPVGVAIQNVPGSDAVVSASFPAAAIGAPPGSRIVPVVLYPGGAVFSAVWQWHGRICITDAACSDVPGAGVYSDFGDGLEVTTDYTAPAKKVSLALAPPGEDPPGVTYQTSASMAESGGFSGQLGVGGLSGSAEIYARACFGNSNCAYATRAVVV
jgi:hypothetical protein